MRSSRSMVREAGEPAGPTSERALAVLWRNADALSEGLTTEDGRRFRVLYPGRDGGGAGPDFRDSVIATETGELLIGDVELHLDAPDWDGHGHRGDPNYNGVILHVVLRPRGRVSSEQQSRARVPVASLGPFAETLSRTESRQPGADGLVRDLGEGSIEEVLDRAGDQRFFPGARASPWPCESPTLRRHSTLG